MNRREVVIGAGALAASLAVPTALSAAVPKTKTTFTTSISGDVDLGGFAWKLPRVVLTTFNFFEEKGTQVAMSIDGMRELSNRLYEVVGDNRVALELADYEADGPITWASTIVTVPADDGTLVVTATRDKGTDRVQLLTDFKKKPYYRKEGEA